MDETVRGIIDRVLSAISSAEDRAKVGELIALSRAALDGLLGLDESVFGFFSEESQNSSHLENSAEKSQRERVLIEAHEKSFSAIRRLVSELESGRAFGTADRSIHPPVEEVDSDGWDFDIAEAPSKSQEPPALSALDEFDIEKAFGFVTHSDHAHQQEVSVSQWRDQAEPMSRVLCKEFHDAERRIQGAIERQQLELVLRELDSSQESLTEGLFALLLTTFEFFVGEEGRLNRVDILPGYKNALERSLTLRRGLADLRRVVTAENDWVIQDKNLPKTLQFEAITTLAENLKHFIQTEAFRYMRAPDRIELARFLEKVSLGGYRDAVLSCEGLSRYLESLSIINQREVLLTHDQEVMREIDALLDSAMSILTVSVPGARDLIRQALEQAARLYGRNPPFDERVGEWRSDDSLLETGSGLEALIREMHEALH